MVSSKREFLNKTKEQFYQEIRNYQKHLKPTKEIEGYGAAPLVGEKNYPFLKTHNISNEEEKSSFMNTGEIVKKDYSEIIPLKARNILGSTDQTYIKKVDTKITEELRDIYKAKNPTEFASEFEKELTFNKIQMNKITGIIGAKNPLLKLQATENTSTSKQLEKYTLEDIKAKEALLSLYERGTNEHQMISLLALGSFGVSFNKKLVPTRWAITAYDSTIEKHLFEQLRPYNSIEKYEIYHHKDKGNEFVILLLPFHMQGDVIETFSDVIEHDYFNDKNKLDKAEPATAGGFFATKIAVFEHLKARKRKASIVSIRVIKDYDVPLGVVFVRESVRAAMKEQKASFSSYKEAKEYIKTTWPTHVGFLGISKTVKEVTTQSRLNAFF